MNKKSVTMKDIALKAGVSVTTVSHVISKARGVAQETRELVLRTLDELDYQQSENRQNTGKPALDTLGVITANIQEDYYTLLVKTIETVASKNGIPVLLCDSADDEEKETRNIGMMLNRKVDGLIIAPVGFVPYPRRLRAANLPVVLVDRQYDEHNTSFVGVNNADSAAKGTGYLVDKGCSRVGFIGYDETVYTMRQRVIGYKLGLMQRLPEQTPHILHLKYSKENSFNLIKAFLSEHHPDGLLCGTSDLCHQLISVVGDMGWRVPEELRILTYDDNKWMDHLKYPVSVITQPTVEIGHQAVERVIQLAGNRRPGKRTRTEILFDTQLIDRLKNF
ncbi:MAG: LacI family transcriptional regulator [Candidatus Accumulibacter sp.]|jgi:DNA-binding LacI/PurR family transcriptional regulator|nr:LacI family transcriptional regulator [Accumulibacter sp.]